MSYLNPRDFFLEVARGRTEFSYINKFGINLDVDLAAEEDVAETGDSITWPTAAETLEILSSSSSDDGNPVGIGAREVTIEGVDASWDLKTETITLNGTGVVTLGGTWLRVNRMFVLTAGTSTTNVGTITCRVASAGATRLIIAIGKGQTLHAAWTVPQGYTGYLVSMYGSLDTGVTEATFTIWVRPLVDGTGAWRIIHQLTIAATMTSSISHKFAVPHILAGACDVRLAVKVADDNAIISGGFTVLYATPS